MDTKLLDLISKSIEEKVDIDNIYSEIQNIGADQGLLIEVSWLLWVRLDGPSHNDKRLRLAEIVKALVKDKKIDRRQAMEVFELDCMQAVGLLSDKEATDRWKRAEVRFNTKTAYTQNKFNLLREDTEGYAKLVTCLNHFGDGSLTEETVPLLFEEIQALIGYFDLDPNRVLDLVLDAAEHQPHNDAYIKLVPMFKAEAVVQLLGFKFQGFQKEDSPAAPADLYLLAARLLRDGLITMEGLLTHLSPSDEEIKVSQAAAADAMKNKVEDIGQVSLKGPETAPDWLRPSSYTSRSQAPYTSGSSAAAANGGSGQASEVPVRRPLCSETLELDAGPYLTMVLAPGVAKNQKLGLALALVQAGVWDVARPLMERLTVLGLPPAAWPPMCKALCDLASKDIDLLHNTLVPRGLSSVNPLESRKGLHKDNLQTPEIQSRTFDLLKRIGVFIHSDITLLTKVIRVLRHYVLAHCGGILEPGIVPPAASSPGSVAAAEAAVSQVVLPASMMVPSNVALVSEVWCLLSLFPFQTRFRMYGEIKELSVLSPYLNASSKMAAWEARKVLKRLARSERDDAGREKRETREVMRPYARMLAKVAHASPLSVMEALVTLVENYSNQIEPVADALKYLTPFAFDVLTYVVLSRLTSGRDRVKEDGVNISDWLQNLAAFNAAVCRKHSDMEMNAMCQLLSNALRAGDAFDLLVLKELLEVLTGIAAHSDVSEKQLEGLSGGPVLRDRAVVRTSEERERSSKAWAKGGRKLLAALQQGSPQQRMALPLLLLIAQQRHVIATQTESKHVKLIAEMFDKCQETCKQYISFLQMALPEEEYASLLPPIEVLRKQYSLDPEVVYCMYRPMLRNLFLMTRPLPEDGELEEGEEVPGSNDGDAGNGVGEKVTSLAPKVCGKTWADCLSSMQASLSGRKGWELMTMELYGTFWSLSIEDVYVPTQRYQDEIALIEAELTGIERQLSQPRSGGIGGGYGMGMGSYGVGGAVNPNLTPEEVDRLKKQRSALQDLLTKLQSEYESQVEHCREIRLRLERDKGNFCVYTPAMKTGVCTLMEECLLPRVLYSPEDALYCAKMILLLHEIETPNLSTLIFYNEMLTLLVPVLKCITMREASNLGIFLREVLSLLSHWRVADVYSTECSTKVGFSFSLVASDSRKTTHDQFVKLMFKWHSNIMRTVKAGLENEEWTSRRNALAVLSSVVEFFPVVQEHLKIIRQEVEKLRDSEEREDIKTIANGYLNLLKREDTKPRRFFPAVDWGGPPMKPKTGATRPASSNPPRSAPVNANTKAEAEMLSAAPSDTAAPLSTASLRAEAEAFQPPNSRTSKPTNPSGPPQSGATGKTEENSGRSHGSSKREQIPSPEFGNKREHATTAGLDTVSKRPRHEEPSVQGGTVATRSNTPPTSRDKALGGAGGQVDVGSGAGKEAVVRDSSREKERSGGRGEAGEERGGGVGRAGEVGEIKERVSREHRSEKETGKERDHGGESVKEGRRSKSDGRREEGVRGGGGAAEDTRVSRDEREKGRAQEREERRPPLNSDKHNSSSVHPASEQLHQSLPALGEERKDRISGERESSSRKIKSKDAKEKDVDNANPVRSGEVGVGGQDKERTRESKEGGGKVTERDPTEHRERQDAAASQKDPDSLMEVSSSKRRRHDQHVADPVIATSSRDQQQQQGLAGDLRSRLGSRPTGRMDSDRSGEVGGDGAAPEVEASPRHQQGRERSSNRRK